MDCREIYNFCYPFERYLEQMERVEVPVYDMNYQWDKFFLKEEDRLPVINLVYPWEKYLEQADKYEEEKCKPSFEIYRLDYEWNKLWESSG